MTMFSQHRINQASEQNRRELAMEKLAQDYNRRLSMERLADEYAADPEAMEPQAREDAEQAAYLAEWRREHPYTPNHGWFTLADVVELGMLLAVIGVALRFGLPALGWLLRTLW